MAKLAFYTGNCLPIHALSLEERPLGGTETAVIHVARILQQRGHEVTVFTMHDFPPPSTPRYLPCASLFDPRSGFQDNPFDLLISVKDWKAAYFPTPARKRFYWTGDGADQFANFGIGDKRVIDRLDCFFR